MERMDILILGATGFSGKLVVKHLAEVHRNHEYSDITWGIAGRSKEKTEMLLKELTELGLDIKNILIVQCNVEDEKSLKDATRRAKILINCTGPYEILGRPIVSSCIETRTHYIDISAELHHMLDIYRKYNKAAEEQNVLIIPACGFASIPAASGLMFLQKQFHGTLDTVECYIEITVPHIAYFPLYKNCLVHYGTWASLVHVLVNMPKYVEMKREILPEIINKQSKTSKKSFFHRHNGRFWYPYPGPDDNVMDMSQRYLHKKKQSNHISYKSYCTMPCLIHFIIIPIFFLYYYFCRFAWFRNQLWKYPRVYTLGYMSHQGPSERSRNETKFNFSLTGNGWGSNVANHESPYEKSLTIKVSGSDPGYRTTAVAIVSSALTLTKESSSMPKGGVVMPGAAFQETNIIDKLIANGIQYEVIAKD